MNNRFALGALCAALWMSSLAPAASGAQVVHYVRAGATGAGDGTSWADAFPDLQQALTVAHAGDQVWVAQGTYKPDGGTLDRLLSFVIPSEVQVLGGFAGTEVVASQRPGSSAETILSGDLLGDDVIGVFLTMHDNSLRIVDVGPGAQAVVLDRLTVAEGYDNGLVSWSAAGVFIGESSTVIVRDCLVRDNWSKYNPSGAFVARDSTVSFLGTVFWRNRSYALIIESSTICIDRCRFLGNSGPYSAPVANTIATLSGPRPHMSISNCEFSGNASLVGSGCGGIEIGWGDADIVNCSFTQNSAPDGGAAISTVSGASVHIRNCVLWGDIAESAFPDDVEVWSSPGTVVEYCTIMGPISQFGGVGNDNKDPKFVNPAGADGVPGTLDDDLELKAKSPCIDHGSTAAVLSDVYDLDCDGDVIEPMPLDLNLVNRFEDDPDTVDLAGQPAPVVDRGAYEFSRWTNLGHGLGDEKSPCLVGSGSWTPGLPLGISITGAEPNAFGLLFLGTFAINAPFKGGIMVPYPLFGNGITTDANGQLAAQGLLPANAPPGFETSIQAWFVDASGPKGLTATNAVSGKTP